MRLAIPHSHAAFSGFKEQAFFRPELVVTVADDSNDDDDNGGGEEQGDWQAAQEAAEAAQAAFIAHAVEHAVGFDVAAFLGGLDPHGPGNG